MAGTIVERKRADGTTGYRAEIIIYAGGRIAHRESKTFDRRPAARVWLEKREAELERPGAVEKAKLKSEGATLADAIDRYVATSRKEIGRTKAQVLRSLAGMPIAARPCADIRSPDLVALAEGLGKDRTPQTVANYLSHLQAVFTIARAAWGFELDPAAMADAFKVTRRLGLTGKSIGRDRRPTRAEIDTLMAFFHDRGCRRPRSAPMHRIIPFALYSTRRQEEITRILWSDLEIEHRRVMVRDMKNPGDKLGNNVWVDLPDEALAVLDLIERTDDRIFPFGTDAISASFTRACHRLGIEDLHFHDLRHEGISRLFEMGWNIPHVAAVSGHRSWTSLKRYTHIRESGDRWTGDWWR